MKVRPSAAIVVQFYRPHRNPFEFWANIVRRVRS